MKRLYKNIYYIIALASVVIMGACAELDLKEASEHKYAHIPQVTIQSPLGGQEIIVGDTISFVRVINANNNIFVLNHKYAGTPDTIKLGKDSLHDVRNGNHEIEKYGYPGEYRLFLTNAKGISLSKNCEFVVSSNYTQSSITGEGIRLIESPRNNPKSIRLFESGIVDMFLSQDYSNAIKFDSVSLQKINLTFNINSPIAVNSVEAELTGIPTTFTKRYIKFDDLASVKLNFNNITKAKGQNYVAKDSICVPTVFCNNTDDQNNVIRVKVTLADNTVVTGYLNTWRVINKNFGSSVDVHEFGKDLYKYSTNEDYLISVTKEGAINFTTMNIVMDDNGTYILKTPKNSDASLEWQSLR